MEHHTHTDEHYVHWQEQKLQLQQIAKSCIKLLPVGTGYYTSHQI